MHSWFGPLWFAKSVTWNLSDTSRQIMGRRWCKDKDDQQRERQSRLDAAKEKSSSGK